jgi:hypothetical protein
VPLADHGGFDVIAEIPEATALTVARGLSFGSAAAAFANAQASGNVTVAAAVSGVSFMAPDRLVLDIDIAGTRIEVLRVALFGPPTDVAPWMQLIRPTGRIRVNAPLGMTPGHALAALLTPGGAGATVTVNVNEDSILASPLVTSLLAQAILPDPTNDTLYQLAKAQVLDQFRIAIEGQVRQSLAQLGTVVLAPAPALPSSTSGALNLVARSAFIILSRSIKICYATRTGTGGSTAAITISNLLRSTATGIPVDAMAIGLSNAFVLRDILRDALTVPQPTGLGIPLSAFQRTHPLMLIGPLVTTMPGGPIPGIASLTINSVFGGIDGTNLRLLISMTANGASGAFSISASIDAAFSVTAGAGSPPTLTVGLAGTPTVTTDLAIAWWVYVAAAFVPGGLTLAYVLAAADLFGGSMANGPVAAAIAGLAGGLGGTFTAPSGPGLPPLSIRPPVSLGQPNAIRRTIAAALPGVPTPLPIVDPFLDNDVLLNLV